MGERGLEKGNLDYETDTITDLLKVIVRISLSDHKLAKLPNFG